MEDKLRESLSTINSHQNTSKRYAKNKRNHKDSIGKKTEIENKENIDLKAEKTFTAAYDKKTINGQLLGNIIKNNINELTSKHMPNKNATIQIKPVGKVKNQK